jgi:TolB protein
VWQEIRVVKREGPANRNAITVSNLNPRFSLMQKLLRLFLFLGLIFSSASLRAQRDVVVDILVDKNTIPVRVSANTPELNALAQQAFGVHGRYKLVASGQAYDIKFAQVTPTQVRVDITKGAAGAAFSSDVATGTSSRNALLRAADIAVTKTNGLGLRGFFTAKLAFIRDQGRVKEICVSDLLFGEVKQITHDNALALTPRWAPDGSRILYTSYYKSGFPDIFQIDLGSYQRTTFVSFRGTNSSAHFSPNGSQVAMILTGEGTPEVYTSNAQGRQVTRRTRMDAVKSSPCFSPDSSRLVFAMEPGPQLYVMPSGGGSPQRLAAGFGYVAEPDWSLTKPNLLACTVRSGGYQIAVYDFNKGKAEVVSKAPFDGIEPSWLADGRHLVYTARTRTESRLCVLDTETGKSVAISPTSFGAASQASVWTP